MKEPMRFESKPDEKSGSSSSEINAQDIKWFLSFAETEDNYMLASFMVLDNLKEKNSPSYLCEDIQQFSASYVLAELKKKTEAYTTESNEENLKQLKAFIGHSVSGIGNSLKDTKFENFATDLRALYTTYLEGLKGDFQLTLSKADKILKSHQSDPRFSKDLSGLKTKIIEELKSLLPSA